jgi:hypothetical protein
MKFFYSVENQCLTTELWGVNYWLKIRKFTGSSMVSGKVLLTYLLMSIFPTRLTLF